MSLAFRLIILVAIALAWPLASLVYTQIDLRDRREREIRADVVRTAEQIAAEQRRIFEGYRQALMALALVPEIRDRRYPACAEILASVKPTFQGTRVVGVLDRDGKIACSSTGPSVLPGSIDASERAYFTEARDNRRFTIGRYVFGRQSHTHVLHVSVPQIGADGSVEGVVFASIGLDWLAKQFEAYGRERGAAFSISDPDGTMLVRYPEPEKFVGKAFPLDPLLPPIRSATTPGTFDLTSPLDGHRRIVGYIPPAVAPGGLLVAYGASPGEYLRGLDLAAIRAGVLTAAGSLISIGLAFWFAQRFVAGPIRRLGATARAWRAGDLTVRADIDTPPEIAELGRTFNGLASDLQRELAYKDMLIREVTHRVMNNLQSVLAMFRLEGKEVAEPEARQRFDRAAGRVQTMVLGYRKMQDLKTDGPVSFSEFLAELCRDIAAASVAEGGDIAVEAAELTLPADRAMQLGLVANELVTNALKHGGGTRVAVRLVPVPGWGAEAAAQAGEGRGEGRGEAQAPQTPARPDEPSATGAAAAAGEGAPQWRLTVTNQGRLPADFAPDRTRGFGMKMVAATVRQLGGRMIAETRGAETVFDVVFPVA